MNKVLKITILVILGAGIVWFLIKFKEGCAPCTYLNKDRNYQGPCVELCLHVPAWKILLFKFTGYYIEP